MASSDIKTPKKPLLVIKRGSLYKPSTPILFRTSLKRTISDNSAKVDDPTAKRICSVPNGQSTQEVIKDISAETTPPNPTNKSKQVKSKTHSKDLLKKDAVDLETILKHQKNITPEQLLAYAKIVDKVVTPEQLELVTQMHKTPKEKPQIIKSHTNYRNMTPCQKHEDNLLEYKADGLPQVGDKFNSLEEFKNYSNKHAAQWFFYYVQYDSRNMKTGMAYISRRPTFCCYECSFNKKEPKPSTSKGIRKQKEVKLLQCPARLTLKCKPGEDVFVVTEVCHHHSHEVSQDKFKELPFGLKLLSQDIKDEIIDLAQFNVKPVLVRQYLEAELPGFKFPKAIYNQFLKVRREKIKTNMSPERIKQMLAKIRYIKDNFENVPIGKKQKTKKANTRNKHTKDLQNKSKETQNNNEHSSDSAYEQELMQSDTELQYLEYDTQDIPWEKANENKIEIESVNGEVSNLTENVYETSTEASANDPIDNETERHIMNDEIIIINNPKTGITIYSNDLAIHENNVDESTTDISAEDAMSNEAETGVLDDKTTKDGSAIGTKARITIYNEPITMKEHNTDVTPDTTSSIVIKKLGADCNEDIIPVFEDNSKTEIFVNEECPDNRSSMIKHKGSNDKGMLKQVLDKPTVSDNSDPVIVKPTNNSIKSYQIGDVVIEMIETKNESGDSVVHHQIKSEKEVTKKCLIAELSKLKSSMTSNEEPTKKNPNTLSLEELRANAASKCKQRHGELPEYQVKGLIKIGDTFSSASEFLRYSVANAKNWCFYYHIHDSRNIKTSKYYVNHRTSHYNFSCRFNKRRNEKSRSKGIRKVKPKTLFCPAAVRMTCRPGEDVFTVRNVCHHHSHELTPTMFNQEPHGYRLSQEIKDEIRELAWFKLDIRLINLYVKSKTGLSDLGKTAKNVIYKMKRENVKLNLSPERVKEVLERIKYIKQNFTIPKRKSPESKQKIQEEKVDDPPESDEESEAVSRVEVRLSNILYDHELIQSVKALQESTGCEIHFDEPAEVNQNDRDISNLQAGLKEGSGYYVLQHANDVENDGQIEIDQEVYCMDDNVEYIILPENDKTFERDDTTNECVLTNIVDQEEKVLYEESVNDDGNNDDVNLHPEENVQYEESVTKYEDHCTNVNVYSEENVQYEESAVDGEPNVNVYSEENIQYEESAVDDDTNVHVYSEENVQYEESAVDGDTNAHVYSEENVQYEIDDTNINEGDNILQSEEINEDEGTEETELSKYKASHEYSDNEDEYQTMYQYTNDEDFSNESNEHLNTKQDIVETYGNRDIGVQAEMDNIELESDIDKINKLEAAAIKYDLSQSKLKSNTRGRPQVLLEEAIINRINIEYYINYGGVAPCLENLAFSMGISTLELLKRLYQGDAVFKMSVGRSGKQDRKTVQLTYVPLTITFPFEKFKYINILQEYKKICSRYYDFSISLEEIVEKLSIDLKAATTKLENAELQNGESSKMLQHYQEALKIHTVTAQLLKKSEEDLAEAKIKSDQVTQVNEQNEKLLKRIKDLEELQLSSRLKDAEILKQLLQPILENKKEKTENKLLHERIKELEEKQPVNTALTEKIKMLEHQLTVADAEIKRYQEKNKKVEEIYLVDSQFLLNKIKVLEEELSASKSQVKYQNNTENPSTYILKYTESENKKLSIEVDNLKAQNKTMHDEIERLKKSVSDLKRLK